MKLLIMASAWTFGSLEACIAQAAHGCFDGVEGPAPRDATACRALRTRLSDDGMPFLGEVCTGGDYAPASRVPEAEHLEQFERQLDSALAAGAFLVNCLTGSDSWPLAQCIDYFGRVLELSASAGAEVTFETHRGRPTFNPWSTRELLRALPALQLTCDFSHWCVVCERLVDDPEALQPAIERARHVHARVGYAQGPQVPDPRAPEYAAELSQHERWWSAIWQSAQRRGLRVLTMTPEFGPDGYLHEAPFSKLPVADLAEINTWMAKRQRAHFNTQHGASS
ncbi:MAG: TIM barrel protein [Myxococcales bacterium]